MNTQYLFKLLAVLVLLTVSSNGYAQFQLTARFVPKTANSLVMVRADEIADSDIAKKEKWRSERIKAFNSGMTFIPPTANRLLLAAQLDFDTFEPIWQVSVLEDCQAIDIVKVSERLRGNLESIEGSKAVVLPNDAYLVKINDNTIASMSPANRQMTVRWLRSTRNSVMNLSDYLTRAVKFADANADVIVAFDLEGVADRAEIVKNLRDSGIVPAHDLDAVADSLQTIEGVTLGITINDNVTGAISIDFGSDATPLSSYGKELFLAYLRHNGFMIDDFENWKLQTSGNKLLLSGAMSKTGVRQVSTLIEHPLETEFTNSEYSGDEGPDMKTRSVQYFRSVQTLINEMDKKNAQALDTYARWFEKYARKIDSISSLNVDPEVLDYGRYVADSFLDISGVLMGAKLKKVGDRQQYQDYGWSYSNRWGWGSSFTVDNTRARQQAGSKAKLEGANQAREIMREVQSRTGEVRQQMTSKYQIDF